MPDVYAGCLLVYAADKIYLVPLSWDKNGISHV